MWQREFSDVCLTMMTTLLKTPLRRQLLFAVMDQCCVTEESFSKGFHVWLRGWCQLVLAFYSPQCHSGGSWRAADSQSSVQLALGVGEGRGELDCDG